MTFKLTISDAHPKPSRAVCVGRNFAEHAQELGNPVSNEPVVFIKSGQSLVGWNDEIALPKRDVLCHHEVEVAFLVGSTIQGDEVSQIQPKLAGFCLALDLTLRDTQSQLKQQGYSWELAKSFDGACPYGPVWRLPSNLSKLYSIDFGLSIDNVPVQQGRLEQTIWKPLPLISWLSHAITLLPGDLILTGTPPGVGPLIAGQEVVGWFGNCRLPIARVVQTNG